MRNFRNAQTPQHYTYTIQKSHQRRGGGHGGCELKVVTGGKSSTQRCSHCQDASSPVRSFSLRVCAQDILPAVAHTGHLHTHNQESRNQLTMPIKRAGVHSEPHTTSSRPFFTTEVAKVMSNSPLQLSFESKYLPGHWVCVWGGGGGGEEKATPSRTPGWEGGVGVEERERVPGPVGVTRASLPHGAPSQHEGPRSESLPPMPALVQHAFADNATRLLPRTIQPMRARYRQHNQLCMQPASDVTMLAPRTLIACVLKSDRTRHLFSWPQSQKCGKVATSLTSCPSWQAVTHGLQMSLPDSGMKPQVWQAYASCATTHQRSQQPRVRQGLVNI